MPTESPESPDLFLFRLNKLASVAGQPLIRLCEGRYGITRREWRLIVTLGRAGSMLSTHLALKARLAPARASRAVTLLVQKALVVREPRPNDRRYVEIRLTEEGQRIYGELAPVVQELNDALLSVLTTEERQVLLELFDRLEERAASPLLASTLPKADRRRRQRR